MRGRGAHTPTLTDHSAVWFCRSQHCRPRRCKTLKRLMCFSCLLVKLSFILKKHFLFQQCSAQARSVLEWSHPMAWFRWVSTANQWQETKKQQKGTSAKLWGKIMSRAIWWLGVFYSKKTDHNSPISGMAWHKDKILTWKSANIQRKHTY